ncbi:sel1 repeat family protein [Caulobacter sp. 17J80-11]|nr:sel1 repeat family protein [Caulobacter sp. 17J80-11]
MRWGGVMLDDAAEARRIRATHFGHAAFVKLTAAALVAAVALPLSGCDDDYALFSGRKPQGGEARLGCPRPAPITGVQPGFNDQEREIRRLRRSGFQNDFFAQLELARRYRAERAVDKNLEDPIESSVWYAVALANAEGYAPINRAAPRKSFAGFRRAGYDDCRAWERHFAYQALDRQLSRMSSDEQAKVRDRVVYILSSMGAEGYRTLARIYDQDYGPYGEPADNAQALNAWGKGETKSKGHRAALGLFQRNDVDAYLYNYLAVQTGDVGAYVLLKDFERSDPRRAGYGAFVEAKAKKWVPPFEFYPTDAPAGGVPHSDESEPRGDAYEQALRRINELPFTHVGQALKYLGVTETVATNPDQLSRGNVETLEGMLGRSQDGRLDPIERVRAIQYAAVSGSPRAQLVLAVMYAEGVGVPADYARAFHWFSEADKQGSAEAKFAMSTYFALGVSGVADQDKAKAVVYRIDSALEGFAPTVERVQGILAQVSRSQQR